MRCHTVIAASNSETSHDAFSHRSTPRATHIKILWIPTAALSNPSQVSRRLLKLTDHRPAPVCPDAVSTVMHLHRQRWVDSFCLIQRIWMALGAFPGGITAPASSRSNLCSTSAPRSPSKRKPEANQVLILCLLASIHNPAGMECLSGFAIAALSFECSAVPLCRIPHLSAIKALSSSSRSRCAEATEHPPLASRTSGCVVLRLLLVLLACDSLTCAFPAMTACTACIIAYPWGYPNSTACPATWDPSDNRVDKGVPDIPSVGVRRAVIVQHAARTSHLLLVSCYTNLLHIQFLVHSVTHQRSLARLPMTTGDVAAPV